MVYRKKGERRKKKEERRKNILTMKGYIPHLYVLTLIVISILLLIMYYTIQRLRYVERENMDNSENMEITKTMKNINIKEGYISLKDTVQNQYRDENGIEKCSALLNNSPSLSNVEFNTMTMFVDGLRFRKWKPVKEDLMLTETKSNAEYCYLYDDKKNNTQDAILDGLEDDFACSKLNPMFQSPLITKVFQTEFRDRAHKVPIKKCVFEIDPSKLDDIPLVTNFWARISLHDCHMLSKDLREQLKQKEERIKIINIDLVNIQDSIDQAKNNLVEKENELTLCRHENEQLKKDIENTKKAIEFYVDKVDTLTRLIENLRLEIQLLNDKIEEAVRRGVEIHNKYLAEESAYQGCLVNEAECQRDKTHKTFALEETIKQNKSLVDQIALLEGQIIDFTGKYEVLLERKTKCDGDLARLNTILKERKEELKELTEMYEKCQKENSFYFQQYTLFRDGYNTSSNLYYECLDTNEGLSNRLASCREEVTECITSLNNLDVYREFNDNIDPVEVELEDIDFDNIEPYFKKIRDRIDKMKIDTRELQRQYDFCVLENARLVNLIEELRNRKKIMQDDLKEAKAKFLLLSTKSYGSMSEDIKRQNQTLLDKYLAMNEREFNENIRRQCELDFVSLEKEKDEAVNEGNHLETMLEALGKNDQTCPSSCDISVSQCIIHHNNPEICGDPNYEIDGVFKVYDKDGNLLETVTIRERGVEEKLFAQEGMEYKFFTFESKNPIHSFSYVAKAVHSVNATFKIYDQTDDLVQTLRMTKTNQSERVIRSGLVDLKFFTFETENIDPNHEYQFTAIEGIDGNECTPKSSNEIMTGKIAGMTSYKKIHLYRGITCLIVSSPEDTTVTLEGTLIKSTEFKRVSLATGTNEITFNS